MRPRNRLWRGLTACALSAALVIGSAALTTTSAHGAPDAPVAADVSHEGPVYRSYSYTAGSDLTVDLDATGGVGGLTYQVVDQPTAEGAVIGEATVSGSVATLEISRQANPGPATFTYKAIDADGVESNLATVSFEVVNQLPLTRDLEFTTERGAALDLWPYARDAESGGPFPWTADTTLTYSDPEHGTIKPFFTKSDRPEFAAVDHKATYIPNRRFIGTDVFTYTMTDTDGGSTTGTITVHVTKPEPTVRGEVNNLRYRCAYYVKMNEDGEADPDGEYSEVWTDATNYVMGGDVAFGVDVRAKAPRSLSPGQKYKVPNQEIDLTMDQGMSELLAGTDLTGPGAVLETVGFGQTAVGGQATASARFTETASGKEYGVPMSGLKSEMMPMSLPVPPEGVTIPVTGGLPRLTAPKSGDVVVSMPRKFFIDAILEPGVLGSIRSVGLDCKAASGQDLELIRVPVVNRTATTAKAPRVAYGKQAKVKVNVSKKATGKVRVFKGKKRIGVAKLKRGRATVKLGRTSLKPGKHRLTVKYAGNKHFKASNDRTRLRVTKASPKVRAVKAGPKRVVARKTRARIRVRVRAAGLDPRGRIVIRSGGRVVGKGRVHDGRTTMRVKRFKQPGKKRLRVLYRGTPTIKAGSDRLTIRVKRR